MNHLKMKMAMANQKKVEKNLIHLKDSDYSGENTSKELCAVMLVKTIY